MPFQEGENVGPYTIIEQLGQGGMATVFKAYHAALDRNVAIKALHPAFMQDPQFLERFQREARVVANLDHPNIVPVYDYADHGGQTYLVMKYIEGETLKAVLDRGWPSKEMILHMVRAVGGALTYAHAEGVLHRDVKPSNILLTEDGGVFLADFGLARMAEAGQSTLSGDQLLGTPHYISPEQARGEQDLDEGTDIYSLGIVLYQLAVGRVPYSSDTPFSIIHDHIYTPLPLPRSLNEQIPEELEQVLLKALSKDRADRFATVSDLVQAFETALGAKAAWAPTAVGSRQPPPVASVSPDSSDARQAKRWPWVVGGLAFSMICLLTFFAGMRDSVEGSEPIRQSEAEFDPGPEAESPVATAQQLVEQHPDDPQARLELAAALEQTNQLQRAAQELAKAAELFLAQEQYLAAAEAIVSGMKRTERRPDADLQLSSALTQALFLGAEQGDAVPMIDSVESLAPEWPPLRGLRARALLYDGQVEPATQILEEVLARAPQDLIANAVMVDVYRISGDNLRARQLTNQLLERDRLPPWLQGHLQSVAREL
jgi:serine/threonine protein kinase